MLQSKRDSVLLKLAKATIEALADFDRQLEHARELPVGVRELEMARVQKLRTAATGNFPTRADIPAAPAPQPAPVNSGTVQMPRRPGQSAPTPAPALEARSPVQGSTPVERLRALRQSSTSGVPAAGAFDRTGVHMRAAPAAPVAPPVHMGLPAQPWESFKPPTGHVNEVLGLLDPARKSSILGKVERPLSKIAPAAKSATERFAQWFKNAPISALKHV